MSEFHEVPLPHGEGESPRDTDPLHEALQLHISTCDQCRNAIEAQNARNAKFGTPSKMCAEYFKIVGFFASGGR